jgi:hypothetical protein
MNSSVIDLLNISNPLNFSHSPNISHLLRMNVSQHIQLVMDVERMEMDAVASSVIECEPPWSYVDPHVLPTVWRVLYWTCQFLTW